MYIIKDRISQAQHIIKNMQLDLFIIEDPINLFYFTQKDLSTGLFIISSQRACLFVDGRYFEACKKEDALTVILYSEENLKNYLKDLITDPIASVGFDSHCCSYANYLKWVDRLQSVSTETKHNLTYHLVPTENFFTILRSTKSLEEMKSLRSAAELNCKGFDFVLQNLRDGITEKELSNQLEIYWKQHGGDKLAFEPIIAFGSNSSMPHYRSKEVPLKTGDIVLIDIGVVVDHYHSDMTRVVFYKESSPKLKEIYTIVQQAQQAALNIAKAGILVSELDLAARSVIESAGYGEYFTHSLGHGVGLEIHESPRISHKDKETILKEGMVVTIEPGIYLPEIGGVRIEDTIIITKEGHENLTQRSKDLQIIL